MMKEASAAAIAACKFTFRPVFVDGGRQFRGHGYLLSRYEKSSAYGSYDVAEIWNPETKSMVYANCQYVVDDNKPDAVVAQDRVEYVNAELRNAYAWAEKNKPDESESELIQFARNIIYKRKHWLAPAADEVFPDQRDPAVEVEKTLQWAMNLTTRPAYMYGRHCAGGKALGPTAKARKAYAALCNKGVNKLPGFEEAWKTYTTLFNLPDVRGA